MAIFYKNTNGTVTFVSHAVRNIVNKKVFFAMAKKSNITLYRMKCELKKKR